MCSGSGSKRVDYISKHDEMDCPFCGKAAKLVASMQDSVKYILYYTCPECGNYQIRRDL